MHCNKQWMNCNKPRRIEAELANEMTKLTLINLKFGRAASQIDKINIVKRNITPIPIIGNIFRAGFGLLTE